MWLAIPGLPLHFACRMKLEGLGTRLKEVHACLHYKSDMHTPQWHWSSYLCTNLSVTLDFRSVVGIAGANLGNEWYKESQQSERNKSSDYIRQGKQIWTARTYPTVYIEFMLLCIFTKHVHQNTNKVTNTRFWNISEQVYMQECMSRRRQPEGVSNCVEHLSAKLISPCPNLKCTSTVYNGPPIP